MVEEEVRWPFYPLRFNAQSSSGGSFIKSHRPDNISSTFFNSGSFYHTEDDDDRGRLSVFWFDFLMLLTGY